MIVLTVAPLHFGSATFTHTAVGMRQTPSRMPSPSHGLPSAQVEPLNFLPAGNPKPSAMTTTRQSFLAGPPPGMVTAAAESAVPSNASTVVIDVCRPSMGNPPFRTLCESRKRDGALPGRGFSHGTCQS